MSSQTMEKIPVLHFSKENSERGTSSWMTACNDVRQALEEYGCFAAEYYNMSSELDKEIFQAVEDLFNLSTETKLQNTNDKPYHGYIKQAATVPLRESLGIDNPTSLEGTKRFTHLMWPAGNDHFSETTNFYSKVVGEMNEMVMRMIFESYGLDEKGYQSLIEPMTYLLRLIKYRGLESNESGSSYLAHTDMSFTTILHQNQVRGLEFRTKGGVWMPFEPLTPSSFLFLAGDALMAWSNDRIQSATHRVTMSGSKARYSLGLFSISNGTIQTPEELVSEEHPLSYKPFDHQALIRFFYSDEGKKGKCVVKAYCGL